MQMSGGQRASFIIANMKCESLSCGHCGHCGLMLEYDKVLAMVVVLYVAEQWLPGGLRSPRGSRAPRLELRLKPVPLRIIITGTIVTGVPSTTTLLCHMAMSSYEDRPSFPASSVRFNPTYH